MDELLIKAINFATNAHKGATRKDGVTPYIVHPLEVLNIASTMTDDVDVLCTAVLHDTVEDTSTTLEDIKNNFNDRIAELVSYESENKREEMPKEASWKIRKMETIEHLAGSTKEEQILVLSDKLSNFRAIYDDFLIIGNKVWNKFNQKNIEEQKWYYTEIAKKLDKVKDTEAYKEYTEKLAKVFE